MAYDGLMTAAVLSEMKNALEGSKIEKISQPETDRIVMQLRTQTGRRKLLLDVSPQGSRVQFTDLDFENPQTAPNFCMLLRKHIQGGVITAARQHGMERLIELDISTINEMGYSELKRLVVETMGKHSNIVLLDAETGKIIDSIKRVSIDINRVRQILPGVIYEYPPVGNLSNDRGYGPTTNAAIENGAVIPQIPESSPDGIRTFVYVAKDVQPKDFHVFRMPQYISGFEEKEFPSLCEGMDWFYSRRQSTNRQIQRASDLSRHVNSLIDKYLLKKQRLLEEIKKADNADIYRLKGELLNANLHLASPGSKKVNVISYYDGSELEIELDEKVSAAKNAQNYYKKYAKLKSSKKEKEAQLASCEADIDYLQSVQAMAQNASTGEELDAIKDELAAEGFVRQRSEQKKKKKSKPSPRRYKLPSGLEVLVGRNNSENDYITFKLAQKTDWWFHTKDIHGSHVILVCNGVDPSPEDMYGAAAIAAWFSKGRESQNVPVDYAPARYVKKPSGAKPGKVIFTNNGTVWIDPKDPEGKEDR